MQTSINIKIGGQAGEGIKTTGLILSKAFARLGFSIFSYDEYPSLIRGGHNCYQMLADHQQVYGQKKKVDILICLDEQSLVLHQSELKDTSLILYDPDKFKPDDKAKYASIGLPWVKLAQQAGGSKIMANMVSLGGILALCSLPLETLFNLISSVFKSKGDKVVESNKKAAQAGFDFVKENFSQNKLALEQPQKKDQIVILGNEAMAVGAIAAGMKYFAAYPMTPVSSVLHYLASKAEKYNLVVNHAENEIAAVNTSLGAAAAGVRAMTATSGGGFCLMAEGLGMAGMAEVPLVLILGMRTGPSSGMPTWTGQGDLLFSIYASQDEFPRLVLTPGDAFEAFDLTKKAFELSEKYQLPAILLVDKILCESHYSGSAFAADHDNQRIGFAQMTEKNYQRYGLSDSGVSPRPFLGQRGGACLMANSYEHGPDGLGTEEISLRKEQVEKRLKKLESIQSQLWDLPLFGDAEGSLTLVGFGTTSGPAREALKQLPRANYLHFNYVWPFPVQRVKKLLGKGQRVICLEGNATGQLEALIRQKTGIEIKERLRKYDGRPFYPEEIIEYINKNG